MPRIQESFLIRLDRVPRSGVKTPCAHDLRQCWPGRDPYFETRGFRFFVGPRFESVSWPLNWFWMYGLYCARLFAFFFAWARFLLGRIYFAKCPATIGIVIEE